jgi:hypothetical protein
MKGSMHTNRLCPLPHASIRHDITILLIMKTNLIVLWEELNDGYLSDYGDLMVSTMGRR